MNNYKETEVNKSPHLTQNLTQNWQSFLRTMTGDVTMETARRGSPTSRVGVFKRCGNREGVLQSKEMSLEVRLVVRS